MNLIGRIAVPAVLLAASIACDGSRAVEPDLVPVGTIRGEWDGKSWVGSFYGLMLGDTLLIIGHRPDPKYLYYEQVDVTIISPRVGSSIVEEGRGRLSKIVGGDAGHFPGADGTLVIATFDLANRRISGKVDLVAAGMTPKWVFEGTFNGPIYTRYDEIPQVRRN